MSLTIPLLMFVTLQLYNIAQTGVAGSALPGNSSMTYTVHDAQKSENASCIFIKVTRSGGDFSVDGSVRITIKSVNNVTDPSVELPFIIKNIVFQNAARTVRIKINITDDDVFEDNEIFEVTLYNPFGGTIERDKACVTIMDDDQTP